MTRPFAIDELDVTLRPLSANLFYNQYVTEIFWPIPVPLSPLVFLFRIRGHAILHAQIQVQSTLFI